MSAQLSLPLLQQDSGSLASTSTSASASNSNSLTDSSPSTNVMPRRLLNKLRVKPLTTPASTPSPAAPDRVSILDDDNYGRSYSFNDLTVKDVIYSTVIPLSKTYIIESQYSAVSLREWGSRYARWRRARHLDGNGQYTLPRGHGQKGGYRPIDAIFQANVRGVGKRQFEAQILPGFHVDRKNRKIWTTLPETRIVPVKNVVFVYIQPALHMVHETRKIKAIIPYADWVAERHEFKSLPEEDEVIESGNAAWIDGLAGGKPSAYDARRRKSAKSVTSSSSKIR